jgi:hypothetical protein
VIDCAVLCEGQYARGPLCALAAGALLLSGCGTNSLRVESAGEVAAFAEVVSQQARAVLAEVDARRERAFITLIASDESCEPVQPVLILVPVAAPVPGSESPPLCAASATSPPKGYEVVEFEFSPLSTAAIQPTLDLAGAVAVYGAAMAELAAQPAADSVQQLDEILALASRARATATGFGLRSIPGLGTLSDEQKSSAAKLIDLVRTLQSEQERTRDIRRLYAERAAQFQSILPELSAQIEEWVTVAGVGADLVTITNLQRAYRNERSRLDLEGRAAMLTLIRDAQGQPARTEQAAVAFGDAVEALQRENEHLGELLANPSAEDRARAARVSRQRILGALEQIAQALTAWKVF